MFLAVLFKKWKHGDNSCPSKDKYINRWWHKYTMKYSSTVKRDLILNHHVICQIYVALLFANFKNELI